MTYRELKVALDALTEEQLDQTVTAQDEDYIGDVTEIWQAEDDYINPSGDGAEPITEYRGMAIAEGYAENEEELEADLKDEPIVIKKGSLFLMTERPTHKEPAHV